MKQIFIKSQTHRLPIFLPDATRAVVKSIDSQDITEAGIKGMVVKTYHLMNDPGTGVIQELGGVKKFMNWPGLVVSDSGGFQVLSLIYRRSAMGKVTDEGVTFKRETRGGWMKDFFSPEKSIDVQFDLGSDIVICLDDVPAPEARGEDLRVSVERTIAWARRCREECDRQVSKRQLTEATRPRLFAVVQGGSDKKLREYCAAELIKIGFDGYGFGGWPVGEDGQIDMDILQFVAGLLPDDKPKYALGVGTPYDIVQCAAAGYQIFDTVLPTRDARHERLYVLEDVPRHSFISIGQERYSRDSRPVSEFCDCHTCQNFSRAYLHHLFKIGDFSAGRLATIHNLRTYARLMELLGK